ncbi:MAG: family transporter [Naasia sp.]|nr:family transporter [Naasia sp.]
MREDSSATHLLTAPVSRRPSGLWWGALGVAAFSLTVPLTRSAIDGLDPLFVAAGRAVGAAALAAVVLCATRQRLPRGRQWVRLLVVAGGVVAGFPLLTSYALTGAPAGHAAVVIGLLPAATAVVAVLRTGERPSRSFWIAAAAGAVAPLAFAASTGGGLGAPHAADHLLLGAVVAAAIGYAEGGLLARELGAWQVISWALLVALPLMAPLTLVSVLVTPPAGSCSDWAAFGYLAVVSMFLGFFAWYRGLALGPMARVGQIQLAQPVLSIGWAALLLGEAVTLVTAGAAMAVFACAAIAFRARVGVRREGRSGESTRPGEPRLATAPERT